MSALFIGSTFPSRPQESKIHASIQPHTPFYHLAWLRAEEMTVCHPSMPAYIIARVRVTDWERYRQYTKATPAIIEKFGGRFVVRGGETITLEGPQETARLVLIEFPSLDHAKAFYHSEEYSRTKKLREGAATGQFLAVDGYAM
jgi:uncharacterized protein (DUF1330 family)